MKFFVPNGRVEIQEIIKDGTGIVQLNGLHHCPYLPEFFSCSEISQMPSTPYHRGFMCNAASVWTHHSPRSG